MTATTPNNIISKQTTEFLDKVNSTITTLLDSVAELKIDTDDDYEGAVDVLKTIKTLARDVEATRTNITKPINEDLRAINALFSEPNLRLQMAEKHLKQMTAKYVADKRAEQQRIIAEAAAELERAKAATASTQSTPEDAGKFIAAVVQAASAQAPAISGISFSERWDWSVVDLASVPREFLCVDAMKVNAAVKNGTRQINGLNIFPVTQTRVVAGK